jgi:hypothetical protein
LSSCARAIRVSVPLLKLRLLLCLQVGEDPELYDEGVEFIRREYRSMLSGPDTFVSAARHSVRTAERNPKP